MRRHRQDLQPLTEINVTNLLDTAFVLLMAFMVVAPSIKHGISLDIPETSGQIIDKDETKTVTVVIEYAGIEGAEDAIYIEDTSEKGKVRRVTLEDLTKDLELKKMTYPKLDVFLEVDSRVAYESFAKTLGTIKASGIENVGLITDPLPEQAESER